MDDKGIIKVTKISSNCIDKQGKYLPMSPLSSFHYQPCAWLYYCFTKVITDKRYTTHKTAIYQ